MLNPASWAKQPIPCGYTSVFPHVLQPSGCNFLKSAGEVSRGQTVKSVAFAKVTGQNHTVVTNTVTVTQGDVSVPEAKIW